VVVNTNVSKEINLQIRLYTNIYTKKNICSKKRKLLRFGYAVFTNCVAYKGKCFFAIIRTKILVGLNLDAAENIFIVDNLSP